MRTQSPAVASPEMWGDRRPNPEGASSFLRENPLSKRISPGRTSYRYEVTSPSAKAAAMAPAVSRFRLQPPATARCHECSDAIERVARSQQRHREREEERGRDRKSVCV